jgi:RNA polymerase sigma-70 factor (ECF subfamily)
MSDSDKNKIMSDPENWVDNYADYLYGFALTRLRETRLAEDMVQETFLAALKSRHSFAGQSSEKTWLVGILKNKIIDHFRKSQREISAEEIEAIQNYDDPDFETFGIKTGQWLSEKRPADWMIDPSNPAETGEFWEYLKYCLSQAPKQIADIFVLREIDGLENKEICNKIGINPTNLRVMLHRARKQLRRCLEVNWINKDNNKE